MPDTEFSFELIAQDDQARLGKIKTTRGVAIHHLHACGDIRHS